MPFRIPYRFRFSSVPTQSFGRTFDNGPQPGALDVSEAKSERIHSDRPRHFFDVRFTSEVVGHGGKRAVRPLPQW